MICGELGDAFLAPHTDVGTEQIGEYFLGVPDMLYGEVEIPLKSGREQLKEV